MTSPLQLALDYSRYARQILQRHPDWGDALTALALHPITPQTLDALLADLPADEAALKRRLREVRQRTLLGLMARDLADLADLDEVVTAVSALADRLIRCAADYLERQLGDAYGRPIGEESGAPQRMIVLGMGKLGGGELNVSSDIDLVFLYDEDGQTDGPKRLSNHEYFTLLGRKLIQLISEATEDGFAFRVDMRLRPYGDSGPLVMSFGMLEPYLLTQGRAWERFAWMKARAITGDGEVLQTLVRPFVFRKYLDYGAYAGIRDLHAQIRREVARRDRSGNIKLGPGGIREIEFIAQIFQLIRGGRETELQLRGTRAALRLIADKGLLPAEAVGQLLEAYDFLRRVEHRLQYRDDQQTQTLPTRDDELEALARSMGFDDSPSFMQRLDAMRRQVTQQFEQVFDEPEAPQHQGLTALWQGSLEQAAPLLTELGFGDGEELSRLLHEFRQGPKVRQLPAGNRQRLDQLMPNLIAAAAKQPHADASLRRLLRLMEAISRREAYLALLTEHPQTLERVAELYNASPWVSDFLTLHPILLDELLDTRILYKEPDWPEQAAVLRHLLEAQGDDVEQQMNAMREFQHALIFRLVASDLAGRLTLERLSDHLAALADLILQETVRLCWLDVRSRHRPEPSFAVVAYGKLGAKELGYASDLDIIFLYRDDHENAAENYAKLAKKISNWLTTLTRAGILYDVDLRLRPNGASGLLVSSTEAFEHYQLREAWVWEHQALTRARFCAGDASIGAEFDRIRAEVLARPHEAATLRDEVLAMRQKMRENHKRQPDQFDLKQDPGGLIDLEFAVQYLILLHTAEHRSLLDNVGNIALLHRSAELGLLRRETAAAAADAYRRLRQEQHALRLAGLEHSCLAEPCLEQERRAVVSLWKEVFAA